MLIDVNITQENINKGVRKHGERCPIALALRDLRPNTEDISVSDWEIILWGNGESFEAVPPAACQLFINNFDNGIKVEPTIFLLNFSKEKFDEKNQNRKANQNRTKG